MKIAAFGIPDFTIGKKIVADQRLDKLKEILHLPKAVSAQVEIVEQQKAREAEGIICLDSAKQDLILSDLEFIEDRLNKATDENQKQFLLRCQKELEKENLLCELNFTDEEKQILRDHNFLTLKPVLMVGKEKSADFHYILPEAYRVAGYICFFTSNEKEVKSWPIKKGKSAAEAAGCIHSDIQRGFIKAEVLSCEDIIKSGGINQAKSNNLLRLEDKEYVVKDGDLIKFRFSK